MEDFLSFLSRHTNGILILVLLLLSFVMIINWLAMIFSFGRYKNQQLNEKNSGNLGYMVTQFFANLINDFKHFLALIIIVIFAGLIVYSMAATPEFEDKMEALQLVIASLGGLVGTVIGYYFGESAVRNNPSITTNNDVTQFDGGSDEAIQEAPEIEENE